MNKPEIVIETIVREETFNVEGARKLTIGDPMYLDSIAKGTDDGAEKELVFDGRVDMADLGRIRLRQVHAVIDGPANYMPFETDTIEATIVQGSREEMLDTYLDGKYYAGAYKDDKDLGCDTACFVIDTGHGRFDEFHTGADGHYGHIYHYRQGYGMSLELSFDMDLFTFEEVKERLLALFPERK